MRQSGPALRGLLKGPRRLMAAAAAVVVLAGAGTWSAVASDGAPPVHRSDRVMTMADGTRIDTSYFTGGSAGRRPPSCSDTASAAARTTSGSRPRTSPATDTRC